MMKTMTLLTALLVLVGSTGAIAAEPTFERDVLPILTAHCLACHGGVTQQNDLDMRTHASLLRGGKSGPVVTPGKADDSLLWRKIEKDEMPKTDNKVSPAGKAVIRRWIESGAKSVGVARQFSPPEKRREPLAVARDIDRDIDRRLAAAQVPASPRSDDAEFLRRATLDITGRIPTAEQARAFLASSDPEKRRKLIDELLTRPEYGQHFATEWVNSFRRISMNTTGRRLGFLPDYTRLVGDQLHQGRGWHEVVREALTATGPYTKDAPQAVFSFLNFSMNGEVSIPTLTGNLSQVLLGIQLQCAECHNHPYSDWKQTDFWGLAAFFKNTKIVNGGLGEPTDKSTKSGDPVAITIPSGGARNAGKKVPARFMLGEEPKLDPQQPTRPVFADWLTAPTNPFFARAQVNRVGAHFFGRGFVNPLNDFNDANPPSHPELLDLLAGEFAASGFDLRHLVRCICLSEAYQRSSRSLSSNEKDTTLFSHMAVKPLTPEMLYDSLCVALELPEIAVPGEPALLRVDSPQSARARFVRFFRGLGGSEDATEYSYGVPQVLRLLNQPNLKDGGRLVERLLKDRSASPEQVIETLYLNTLSRPPDAQEKKQYLDFVNRQESPRVGYGLALWVLINRTDFVLNR